MIVCMHFEQAVVFIFILDSSKGANEGVGEDPYGGSTDEDSDMDTREAPGENLMYRECLITIVSCIQLGKHPCTRISWGQYI